MVQRQVRYIQGREAKVIDAKKKYLHEFVVFTHPLMPTRIVDVERFSWPAFLIGPLWLVWRRLWLPFFVAVITITALYFLGEARGWLVREVDCNWSLGYKVCSEEASVWVPLWIQVFVNFVCAMLGNKLWGDDLLRRGYIVTDTTRAKSLDHARAIFADTRRQPWDDTLPTGQK